MKVYSMLCERCGYELGVDSPIDDDVACPKCLVEFLRINGVPMLALQEKTLVSADYVGGSHAEKKTKAHRKAEEGEDEDPEDEDSAHPPSIESIKEEVRKLKDVLTGGDGLSL